MSTHIHESTHKQFFFPYEVLETLHLRKQYASTVPNAKKNGILYTAYSICSNDGILKFTFWFSIAFIYFCTNMRSTSVERGNVPLVAAATYGFRHVGCK